MINKNKFLKERLIIFLLAISVLPVLAQNSFQDEKVKLNWLNSGPRSLNI